VDRVGVISVTPVSSRSAEVLYEPSELALARQKTGAAASAVPQPPVERCATPGLRARPTPDPEDGNSDISKWQKE
jgi:hypothetical protein